MSELHPEPITGWKRWRFRLEALGVHTLAGIVPVLPRSLVRHAGAALGWFAYYGSPSIRSISRANLDLAYGEHLPVAQKTHIARASCQSFATTLLTFLWSPRFNREAMAKIVEMDEAGLQLVRRLQTQGRPIIFITLHYGDWELLGLTMGLYRIPLTIPTRTMRNASVEAIFARLRARTGHQIIPRRHAAGKLLKALQRGGCVALLIDQHVPATLGGIWCRFFGVPALATPAAAQLALHSGATLIGAVARPLPDGRFRVTFAPEIADTLTGDKTADVLAITQRCLDFCESVIRERPEYWLWSYKRWKHYPGKGQERYPFYARPAPPVPSRQSQ